VAELQAALRLSWSDGALAQAAARVSWGQAADVQSVGAVAYVPPAPAPGQPVASGSLAPRVDVVEALVHQHTHTLLAFDLRAYQATLAALAPGAPAPQPEALPVRSGSLSLGRGSALWELRAQGAGSLAGLLAAGEQPPLLGVRINGEEWHFVVEGIDQPQAFASSSVSISGRSLAALADAPYQPEQNWITEAPTTAAQLAALANTFTDVVVDWRAPDWLIPAGAWSYQGTPLGVVGQVAQAIDAVVEAARAGASVTVQRRYPVLPNEWATTAPDWQVHYSALERSNRVRADTPEYNAVLVAGQQQGGTLLARYAGTSGAVQAPLVTDPLLTDGPALQERATAILAAAGKQDEVTRVLQAGPQGVAPRGALVRFVDPDETWVGMVRSVQVDFGLGRVRQTLGLERRTAFQAGVFVPPPPPVLGPDFVAYAQQSPATGPLSVPEHQAGDLLFVQISALNGEAPIPNTLPGWESVCTGGNGPNQIRWRIMRRVDTDNTITQIPTGADNSLPQWVVVTRRAAFVQGATVPGEFSGDGTVGTGATVPLVSITSSGNKILSGVYAQNGNVDWVGAENMIPIAVSEGTAAWGVWISPAQTEATWPGYTVNWFFSNGSSSNQFYTRWYVELSPAP
jgi:hypothetical protein